MASIRTRPVALSPRISNSRSVFAAPVLWLIANLLWRGYMRKAPKLAKAQIETEKP
jgi:hypothetical protein